MSDRRRREEVNVNVDHWLLRRFIGAHTLIPCGLAIMSSLPSRMLFSSTIRIRRRRIFLIIAVIGNSPSSFQLSRERPMPGRPWWLRRKSWSTTIGLKARQPAIPINDGLPRRRRPGDEVYQALHFTLDMFQRLQDSLVGHRSALPLACCRMKPRPGSPTRYHDPHHCRW